MHTENVTPLASEIGALLLVDHHCHGVSATALDRDSLASLITEGGREMLGVIDPVATPLGLAVRSLCAPILDVEPHAPIEEYLERRSELGEHVVAQRMLRGAGLSDLLIDTGHLADQVLTPADMKRIGPFQTYEIVRIEAVAEEVFASAGPATFIDEFAQTLSDRARAAVGLKSIVAYRAGLDIDAARPSADATSEALSRWSRDCRLEDPVLLRHCLWAGLDIADELRMPVQLHSGFGDRDLELWRADPTRFTPWLDRIPASVKICFLHCWPYHRQAACLAAIYPNVYFDTGEIITHAALGYDRILAESLEVAPFEKVLFSSDAYGPPELYFIAANRFRSAIYDVINCWHERGLCSASDAIKIVTAVGRSNAECLYRLDQ